MTKSCFNCFYLNKEQKEIDKYDNIQYGCDSNGRFGFVPFTVKSEKELKTGGCSDWIGEGKTIKLGQLFRFFTSSGNKYVCQYCGKIGSNYLIWNQTLRVFKEVKQSWFKKNIHHIQITKDMPTEKGIVSITKEDKQAFRKRMAQARKERYEQQCRK